MNCPLRLATECKGPVISVFLTCYRIVHSGVHSDTKAPTRSDAFHMPDTALSRNVHSSPPMTWGALADLYQRIGEPDFLRVVRLNHVVKCDGATRIVI
jgi:hypothetical protein